MRIVQIAAGAGGMYCGACLHANTLASALRAAGHDVLLVPAYTPLRVDDESASVERVVFGGINVYLQQFSALFRKTPWGVDRFFDQPWLLRWAGRMASSTDPRHLGPMTVSMLRGHEGRQRKELDKLVDWLEREVKPDVVHLSTALLVGMAPQITERLGIPVVASLTGEDGFIEKLPEPYYSEARDLLAQHCDELAGLVAMNRYYAGHMTEYLRLSRGRIDVVPVGVNLPGRDPQPRCASGQPFTIGFLARICPEKGLHLLADAFALLANDRALPPLRLRAAGYLGKTDRDYLATIQSRLAGGPSHGRFEYVGELDRPGKIAFLQSLDALSLPTVEPECKGLPVFEAWASGVAVVLPEHGAFPEMIHDTGGGLLCHPNDAGALAASLRTLISDRAASLEMGHRGYQAVCDRYHAARMAELTAAVYQRIVAGRGQVPCPLRDGGTLHVSR